MRFAGKHGGYVGKWNCERGGYDLPACAFIFYTEYILPLLLLVKNNLSSNTVNLSSESIKTSQVSLHSCRYNEGSSTPAMPKTMDGPRKLQRRKCLQTWPSYAFTGDAELADYLGICEGTYEVMSQGYCPHIMMWISHTHTNAKSSSGEK